MDPVLNYTEDSGLIPLIPEDVLDEFFFANRGEDTGFSVRLHIVTGSNDDPGRLLLPEGDYPTITTSGNNSSTIIAQSASNAPVNVIDFTAVFRTVQISFTDQAPRRYAYTCNYINILMFFCMLAVYVWIHMKVVWSYSLRHKILSLVILREV